MTIENNNDMEKIGGYGGLISIMFGWHVPNNQEHQDCRAMYFDSITIPDLVTCIGIINKMASNIPEKKILDAWNEIWNLLKAKKSLYPSLQIHTVLLLQR